MFGDLFCQRTDTESGLLYSSRRKFLGTGKHVFEPPPEIQTRKLARRRHMQSLDSNLSVPNYDDDTSLDSIDTDTDAAPPKKKDSVINGLSSFQALVQPSKRFSMEDNTAGKKFRKTAKFVMETVLMESDINVDDWKEETTAGVKYWVNKETGDVATECPWGEQSPPKKFSFHSMRGASMKAAIARAKEPDELMGEDEPEGTGSLVFKQGRDVDELFKLLDSVK